MASPEFKPGLYAVAFQNKRRVDVQVIRVHEGDTAMDVAGRLLDAIDFAPIHEAGRIYEAGDEVGMEIGMPSICRAVADYLRSSDYAGCTDELAQSIAMDAPGDFEAEFYRWQEGGHGAAEYQRERDTMHYHSIAR